MDKLIIGLIGVGAVLFAIGVGIGNATATIIGFILFAIGVLLPRLGFGG